MSAAMHDLRDLFHAVADAIEPPTGDIVFGDESLDTTGTTADGTTGGDTTTNGDPTTADEVTFDDATLDTAGS